MFIIVVFKKADVLKMPVSISNTENIDRNTHKQKLFGAHKNIQGSD